MLATAWEVARWSRCGAAVVEFNGDLHRGQRQYRGCAALVGKPDRRFLWVLSRKPELDATTYERMIGTAAAHGVVVILLERTGIR